MTLKEYMEKSFLTQREMGLILGVAPSTIHNWIFGNSIPVPKNKKMIHKKTKGLVTF
jgi:DNA-binding transcriptional regulator YdaS (Cro superfamily)